MHQFSPQKKQKNRPHSPSSIPPTLTAILCLFIVGILPDLVFCQCRYTITKYHQGSEAHKMSIIWFPSGFAPSHRSLFLQKAVQQTNDMFGLGGVTEGNNWFQDHRNYFDVFILTDDNGRCDVPVWDKDRQVKTKDEIVILINNVISQLGLQKCDFIPVKKTWAAALACLVFPYCIIDRDPITGGNTTHSVGERSAAWFYIGRTANRYEGPHEFVHQGWFHQDVLCDTYTKGPPCIGSSRCLNLDGIKSHRKWRDTKGWNVPQSLLAHWPPEPVEGGRYCSRGVWRSSAADITDGGKTVHFDALGYEAMNRAWRKRYTAAGFFFGSQALEYTNPSIVCNIIKDQVISGNYNIECQALDSSGIQMVEFFIAPEGTNLQILEIDFAPPFTWLLEADHFQEGFYYLRAIAWDRAWNWSQYNVRFYLKPTRSHGIQPKATPEKQKETSNSRPEHPKNLRVLENLRSD
ncbi:MAG: hypothetical protein WHS46_10820 [Desulfosoma sp.]